MILKIFLTFIFFLWGFLDKSLSLTSLGYTFFIGSFVYLGILLNSKKKDLPTYLGFFYYLSLGSGSFVVGFLSFVNLLLQFFFFEVIRKIITINRITYTIFSFALFSVNFLIVSFILNGFELTLSFNFFLLLIISGIIGSGISLLSKNFVYER